MRPPVQEWHLFSKTDHMERLAFSKGDHMHTNVLFEVFCMLKVCKNLQMLETMSDNRAKDKYY